MPKIRTRVVSSRKIRRPVANPRNLLGAAGGLDGWHDLLSLFRDTLLGGLNNRIDGMTQHSIGNRDGMYGLDHLASTVGTLCPSMDFQTA
jgi:hypothetical protein